MQTEDRQLQVLLRMWSNGNSFTQRDYKLVKLVQVLCQNLIRYGTYSIEAFEALNPAALLQGMFPLGIIKMETALMSTKNSSSDKYM